MNYDTDAAYCTREYDRATDASERMTFDVDRLTDEALKRHQGDRVRACVWLHDEYRAYPDEYERALIKEGLRALVVAMTDAERTAWMIWHEQTWDDATARALAAKYAARGLATVDQRVRDAA